MQPFGARTRCIIALLLAAPFCVLSTAQSTSQPGPPATPTSLSHPGPPTSTVDVFALNPTTGAVLPGLGKDDFRLLDDGHPMPIVSFGAGAHYSVTPIALWLVISCNNFGDPELTSGFMRGKTQILAPALLNLDKADAVGVAHWCGDGTQAIDQPPTSNAGAALDALNSLLKRKVVEGANRQWEDAQQRMVNLILDNARTSQPRRTPVLLFLYGDGGYAFLTQTNDVLRSILATSGIVFGLNDSGYHFDPQAMFGGGEIYYEIHYLSMQTGGQVYGSPYPNLITKALDYILLQMHFRYTLGFEPTAFDGKEHDLKIELTPQGKAKYASAVLRYRPEYVASTSANGR